MSLSAELDRLGDLHRRGALSDDEFARAKATVLRDAERAQPGPANAASSAINGLRRSRDNAWLGGVCGGLARVTGLDAWFWRLLFVLLVLCAGTGVLAYLLMWVLVPQDPVSYAATPDRLPAG